ncbi:MAG TPA: ABC transporter ATP-binding protein [Sphingomonas sp.]|nr:ABC transporter ATP-binding protein [Sphingomonas sp.]
MKKRSYLALEGISVSFPTRRGAFLAVQDVDLSIEKGQFVALIGHSGCGKSTLLNVIAGLVKPSRGVVFLDGDVVDQPGPDRAVIFQDHSLLPWMTVEENVRLAVDKTMPGKTRAERHDWILHNLELVQMAHAAGKRPGELSGGMKQRVGIARAIAMNPRVLLMDEPFGALDALTRASLQDAVMNIQAQLNNTVVMITHDVDEAVLLADRVVMMTNGPAAGIGEDLAIDLPRPRARIAASELPAYNHARHAVLEFLHQRYSNPLDHAA